MRHPALPVVAFVLLAALTAAAQEIHSPLCLYGCPAGGPASNDLVIREIYILSSNDPTKFADWVAYRVTAKTIGPTKPRVWKADPALAPNETLEPEDYAGAHEAFGVDRGHQAPLADFTGTPYWEETDYLSNITPQASALNEGPWERLEEKERQLAQAPGVDAVYVVTGPLYERPMPPLPRADEAHMVPSGYWKILAVVQGGKVAAAAFEFDQTTPRGEDICRHGVTVDEVERRSGLDFFHDLDDAAEAQLEAAPPELELFGCEA